MEEKKFPIYSFSASWNQDDFKNNGTFKSVMYKEELTEEKLQEKFTLYKNSIETQQIEKGHPVLEWLECKCEYIEHESWVCFWFSHITYNLFETDQEVEKSFREFIKRKKLLNQKNGHGEIELRYKDGEKSKPFHCFMEAEDSWRWKICRCEHCVALGKITINH